MDTKQLVLYQLDGGYCYNSDSLFLYYFARNFLKPNTSLLDVGTGCGILGLLCARDFNVRLTLNDIHPTMASIARFNAKENKIDCDVINCNILESSLSGFDFIISNPPFYRKDILDSKNEFLYISRQSENLPLDKFMVFVKSALKPRGKLIFCYDARELTGLFASIISVGFNIDYMSFLHPTPNKNANLVMLFCRNSKSQTKILPPLYNFINGSYSNEALETFRICNTFSKKISSLEQIL